MKSYRIIQWNMQPLQNPKAVTILLILEVTINERSRKERLERFITDFKHESVTEEEIPSLLFLILSKE